VKKSLVLMLSLVLAASLAACNMPTEASTEIAPELQTAAALTVQAVLTPLNSPTAVPPTEESVEETATLTQTAGTPQVEGTPSLALSKTATPTLSLTPSITPTYSKPVITFNESTNCRSGPGQNYEILYTFLAGGSTEIVGAYPQDGYWVVKLPDSSDTCWAWGGYATTTGSYWTVPSTTPPATGTAVAPDAPTGLSVYYSCDASGQITVNLKWKDNSNGEEGYRVLRDGEVIMDLPPNSTSYTDIFLGSATEKYNYTIEVYSGDLTARSTPNQYSTFSCQ
jgi:hypothetical protein